MRGVLRLQNNLVRNNGGKALVVEGVGSTGFTASIQNNQFIAGSNSSARFVIVNSADSLLFQGNTCMLVAAAAPAGLHVELSATRANVCDNVVDLPNVTAMEIRAFEALVNANSVRSRPGSGCSGRGLDSGTSSRHRYFEPHYRPFRVFARRAKSR